MRYNEIIIEDEQVLLINSEKRLNTMLSYGEINLPQYAVVVIDIGTPYNIDFPKNFKVNNNLHIKGRPRIISGDLTVNGHFKCNNIFVDMSNLILKTTTIDLNNRILELPKELIVKSSLELYGTEAKKLPNKLHIGHGLYLSSSDLTELPNDLIVGGNLDISYTNISILKDNLTVNGDLNIEGTPITKIPNNLTVNGYLDIRNTQIKELPDDLDVGGRIHIFTKQKIKVPDAMKTKIIYLISQVK